MREVGRRRGQQCTQDRPRARWRRRRGRQNRGGIHNRVRQAPLAGAPLPGLREALRRLRHAVSTDQGGVSRAN